MTSRTWQLPRAQSLAYPVLLALGALDAAGYSVIAPALPVLAEEHHAGPAMIGALASTFPLAMMVGFAAAGRLVRAGRTRTTLLTALAVSAAGAVLFAATSALPILFVARALMGLGSGGLWIGVTFATLAYWPLSCGLLGQPGVAQHGIGVRASSGEAVGRGHTQHAEPGLDLITRHTPARPRRSRCRPARHSTTP